MNVLDLDSLELKSGAHEDGKKEFCIMEAVAYFAGEPWSATPKCACPVLGAFMRSWNDSLDTATRQKLKRYIPRLVGTNDGNSDRRGWMCLDWLSREFAPAFLELAGLTEHAKSLHSLPEILDESSLKIAQPKLAEASKSAAAAGSAARAAARAAAWDAARALVRAAARDAAPAKLAPVVARLRDSAFSLIDRMLSIPQRRAA